MNEYAIGTPVQAGQTSNFSNGNQNGQRTNVSTSMLSLWDASNNGLQLNVLAMTNGLGLSMWVPSIGSNNRMTYPKEQRHMTIVSQKNCLVLEDIIENRLITAYQNGRNAKASIFTNNTKGTVFELEIRDGQFYATMYLGCDPTTRIPQTMLSFKFDISYANASYDHTTGEFEAEPIQADFYLFYKTIKGYNKMCGGLIAGHGTRMVMNWYTNQLMTYIRSIATAVHAQLPAPTFNNFNPLQQSPAPGNTIPTQPSIPQQVVSLQNAMTDISDLSAVMG